MHALEEKLHYKFKTPALLKTALTHPSYGSDHGVEHYQRLEFLGDAALQMAVTGYLFEKYPGVDEGQLTRSRAAIVCEKSLANAAEALGIGEHLLLSVGEERSGGRNKPSILSDAMEAIFGAVYLDGGAKASAKVICRVLDRQLREDVTRENTDDKSQLQILLQKEHLADPVYELISTEGAAHNPVFTVRVTLDGRELGVGSGHSKQSAQQAAAKIALEALRNPQREE